MGLGALRHVGFPRPGIKPVSLALQGRFLTTESPGKPQTLDFLTTSLLLFLKEMSTHSSILAGEFHGQKSLVDYSPWDCKESYTNESYINEYHIVDSQ